MINEFNIKESSFGILVKQTATDACVIISSTNTKQLNCFWCAPRALRQYRSGSSGSRIFPRWGFQPSRGANIQFCQIQVNKLHEIERIWTREGGARRKFYHVDPPLNEGVAKFIPLHQAGNFISKHTQITKTFISKLLCAITFYVKKLRVTFEFFTILRNDYVTTKAVNIIAILR